LEDKHKPYLEAPETWNEEVAGKYDSPGTGMFSDDVVTPTVDFLEKLAAGGNVLEMAIGTGRIAIPLSQRGVKVSGTDFSQAMIDVLYEKVDRETIPTVVGDMSEVQVEGEFSLVYLVFNTISNLLTQEAQINCFKNAARHLSMGGRFVIELWVPELRKLPPGQDAVVFESRDGYIGLDTYDILHQHVVSHHFTFDDNNEAKLNRSRHRYIWPSELDLMARIAGFELESRYADWDYSDFTSESRSHVSVYRLADQPSGRAT
jgi:SAM-dependent methyltransferase